MRRKKMRARRRLARGRWWWGSYRAGRFFRLVLTGKDNATFEITRVLLLVGFVSVVLFVAFDVMVAGHAFDALGYCSGLAALLFGGAGGIAVKARAEPE